MILRGLTLKGAKQDAIRVSPNVTDVVIEDNDIGEWGRAREDGGAMDLDSGIRAICRSCPEVERVTIQRNRIHECGQLPATNLEHGVYVAVARGTRIVGNWIYENADLGIQLYPNARDTYVAGNVIDGNGEGIIFGGLPRVAARDNLVQGNVISNSRLRNNVEWHFEGTVGTGNVVRRNCIGGGARDDGSGGIMLPAIGFTPVANLVAQPEFRAPGDYRLKPGSACTRVLAGDPNRVAGPPR